MAKDNDCDNGKHNSLTNGNGNICIKPSEAINGHSNGHIYKNRVSAVGIDSEIKDVRDSCSLHACIVVLSSATINGTIFGVVNSFGVLYWYLIEHIKNNGSYTGQFLDPIIAGIGSLLVGLIFFCSLIASILADHVGVRRVCFAGGLLAAIGMYLSSLSLNLVHLYITYGVIMGIGASLAYAPSLVILGHYFKRRLGFVNGVVTAGSAMFTVIMPIVLRMLLEAKGIQSTLAYLSILMSLLMICALTFEEKLPNNKSTIQSHNKNDMRMSGENRNNYTERKFLRFINYSLLHNRLFIMWVIAIPIALFGYFVPFVHLVRHAKEKLDDVNGEILVTCIGAFSCIGRFVTGPIADISNVNPIILQQIAFVSIGLLTMLLTVASNFPLLVAICCGLGICDGCFISLLGPIAFDLVGSKDASQAIGLLLCLCSLPLTVGPPIAAYLRDINGDYTTAFVSAGIPPIVGAILMLYILKIQKNMRKYMVSEREDNDNGLKSSIIAAETNNCEDNQFKALVKINDKV